MSKRDEVRKKLLEEVGRVYRKGQRDGRNNCNAEDMLLSKWADQILSIDGLAVFEDDVHDALQEEESWVKEVKE